MSASSPSAGATKSGPGLREFMATGGNSLATPVHNAIAEGGQTLAPYLKEDQLSGNGRKGKLNAERLLHSLVHH